MVGGSPWILWFPPPLKLVTLISLNVTLNTKIQSYVCFNLQHFY